MVIFPFLKQTLPILYLLSVPIWYTELRLGNIKMENVRSLSSVYTKASMKVKCFSLVQGTEAEHLKNKNCH